MVRNRFVIFFHAKKLFNNLHFLSKLQIVATCCFKLTMLLSKFCGTFCISWYLCLSSVFVNVWMTLRWSQSCDSLIALTFWRRHRLALDSLAPQMNLNTGFQLSECWLLTFVCLPTWWCCKRFFKLSSSLSLKSCFCCSVKVVNLLQM